MLKLIYVFLVIVTNMHTHKLSSELKNNPKMKNIIIFSCMYIYICMENRADSELRIFCLYIYSFKYRIFLNIIYIFEL